MSATGQPRDRIVADLDRDLILRGWRLSTTAWSATVAKRPEFEIDAIRELTMSGVRRSDRPSGVP